jgi:hypothetical protein
MIWRTLLGSARASRAGDPESFRGRGLLKACFGEAPKPTREARVLPKRKNHACAH